ncbi:hypothetical protein [Streptomyces sp. NPDC088261]|uniref:hypothetical protein n=1 Tax=Streptomyces sp. NPDC088261 TaxID=3365851 RepID=UPI00381BDBE1
MNTYNGFPSVTDILVGWDEAHEKEVISSQEHFVRGIELQLDGASNYPAAASELAKITGVSDAKVWTPGGYKPEGGPHQRPKQWDQPI